MNIDQIFSLVSIFGGFVVSLFIVLKYKKCMPSIVAFIIGVVVGLPLLFIGQMDMDKQAQAEQLKEKQILDSLTCKDLGQWIINHSNNSTYTDGGYIDKNYPYAEARFSYCTHLGAMP